MIAIIANWAIVPPKLMPGVSMKPGVNSGDSAIPANRTMPNTHFWGRDRPSHQSVTRVHALADLVRTAHTRAFPRLSPSMPVGRISSTSTSSTNATTSRHCVPKTACP